MDEFPDERTKYWVDEILKGITPKMFVWWFRGGLIGPRLVLVPLRAEADPGDQDVAGALWQGIDPGSYRLKRPGT